MTQSSSPSRGPAANSPERYSVIKDKTTATDRVTITGTRTKMWGYGNVEDFLGKIFSESLNKLDIAKLFEKVGLHD